MSLLIWDFETLYGLDIYQDILVIPLVVLPFPVWLSGGYDGYREQEGTTRTQWASPDPTGTWCHIRKLDSCITLCHCVLFSSLVSIILMLLKRCKVTSVFTSLLVDSFFFLHTLTFSLSTHLNGHKLFKALFRSNTHTPNTKTHTASLYVAQPCAHTEGFPLSWVDSQTIRHSRGTHVYPPLS